MTALTAHASVTPPHVAVRRMALPLGAVLAGLWAIELHPAAASMLAPLNLLTAQLTAAMLNLVGLPVVREAVVLTHAGGFACEIYQACTAFTPVALLAAAILFSPASWRARLVGVVVGAAFLIVLNQLRLISLVWLGVYAPRLFDFAHVWLWHALLIAATGGYWLGWMKAARR
jgi:exosortase/archaeosortase family protein